MSIGQSPLNPMPVTPTARLRAPQPPSSPRGLQTAPPLGPRDPRESQDPERRTWLCNPRVRLHISPGRPRPGLHPGPSRRSQSGPSLRRPLICRLSLSAPTLRLLRVHPLSQALLSLPLRLRWGGSGLTAGGTASGSRMATQTHLLRLHCPGFVPG